ncbi:hypothetical protein ACLD0W_09465 [Alloalcanivorax sp. C16-1]|uniref:hypothetical protein n=1 Tax=Alloalcanivorax sp. C16-1 TaxID=3390051 RepID=UPI00397071B9
MAVSSVTSEAILFFERGGIGKSMLFADFEAILDGMVGVPEYAGREMRGAYCVVNGRLKVKALVLFLIDFDADGMADHTWNVPLRHLAEHGGPGPDMGAGPIRLACRSQCPVAWHQDQLWDPSMKPGANDFVAARDLLRRRGAKMGLEVDEDLPPDGEVPTLAGQVPTVRPVREEGDPERVRLARTIKELRLRIHTLETGQKEELARLRYARQQKEEILSAQLEKVLTQFKTLKSQNTALREQNDSLKAQAEALRGSLEEQARSLEEQAGRDAARGSRLERLTEQYKLNLEQRLDEERARLAGEIHSREMDVLNRDEVIGQLRAEIADLKRDHLQVAHSGASKMLEKLEDLGLSFIAFHPGAGHVSVGAGQIADYMNNPQAFAARKCLVTEDHYRAWLAHYENPVCQVAVGPEQTPCGKRVIRVDVPNQFKPGVSDCNSNRCPHCRSDSSIDNVLRFR